MEIVCSELSDDAWFDKKISWSADSGKKSEQGEFIEDTVNFRKKCGEMWWKK